MELIKEINWSTNKGLGAALLLLGGATMVAVLAIQWDYFMKWSWYLFPILPIMIVLHEALHGYLFWRWSGKVKFGYLTSTAGPAFYAASPGCYFTRNRFIAICLAPQLLTIICLSLFFLVPLPDLVKFGLLGTAALNLGGGVGDFYVTWVLLKQPRSAQVEDNIKGVRIYA